MCDVHKIQFLLNNTTCKHIILKEIVSKLTLSQEEKLELWNENSISKYKNNTWSSTEIFITNILKRTPDDGLINWNKPLEDIYNLVRAVTHPYPGAFTFNGLNKIYIWEAQPFDTNITYPNAKYGEIVEIFENNFIVNCMDGLLLVTNHDAANIYVKDILHD